MIHDAGPYRQRRGSVATRVNLTRHSTTSCPILIDVGIVALQGSSICPISRSCFHSRVAIWGAELSLDLLSPIHDRSWHSVESCASRKMISKNPLERRIRPASCATHPRVVRFSPAFRAPLRIGFGRQTSKSSFKEISPRAHIHSRYFRA